MAPEQADPGAGAVTVATDVHGLGATLYALLTGGPPFPGAAAPEALRRVREEDPAPPRRVNPAVPADLDAVCRKCLEKDPGRRYPTAASLADDLDRFLAGRPTRARPVGPGGRAWRAARRRPRLAALVAVTAAAVLAVPGVAGWYSVRLAGEAAARREAEADRREAEADRHEAEAVAEAPEFYAALERVRRRRAEGAPGWASANRADMGRLVRLRPAAGEAAALRTEAAAALGGFDLPEPRAVGSGFKAHVAAFSADGRLLALGGWHSFGGGVWEVRVVDAATGADVRRLSHPVDPDWCRRRGLADADGVRALAFSPDGRWLAAGTRSGRVVVWDWPNPNKPPVTRCHGPPQTDTGGDRVIGLAFAPGGRVLVSAGGPDLVAWDADRGWAEVERAAGRPPGLAVLARPAAPDEVLLGFPAGGRGQRVTGFRPVFQAVGPDAPAFGPAAAGQHGCYFTSTVDHRLSLMDTGSRAAVLTLAVPGDDRTEDGVITDAAVSPDGRLLVTAAEHAGRLKVWDLVGGQLVAARTLGDRGEGSLRTAFSPDARTLAVCEVERTWLYDLPAGVAESVAVQRLPVRDADQSPDGSVIATWAEIRTRDGPPVEIATWDGNRPYPLWGGAGAPAQNRLVAYDPAGGRVADSYGDGVMVRGGAGKARSRTEQACLAVDHSGTLRQLKDLRFAPDGCGWVCLDGRVARWPARGTQGAFAPGPDAGAGDGIPTCVAPGRAAVVIGRTDGSIARHPPDGGPGAVAWPVFPAGVTAVALSQDERTVVAGSVAGDVAVVRVAGGGPVVRLPGAHTADVLAATAGPGGWFATGSADRTVKVWSPDGRPVLTLPQTRPVVRLFWSAAGRTLTVLADGERGLRRWHLDRLRAELAALGLDPNLP